MSATSTKPCSCRRSGVGRASPGNQCERLQRDCRDRAISQIRIERTLGTPMHALLAASGFVEYDKAFVWPAPSVSR
ncbi:MAG: hypothetical protein R3E68_21985 [Burkholderiaceae bacterium]